MKTSIIFVLTLLIAISTVAAFRFRQGGPPGGPQGSDMGPPLDSNGTDSSDWDMSGDGGCGGPGDMSGFGGDNGTDFSYDGSDMGPGDLSGDFDPSSMNMSGPPPQDGNGTVTRRMQTFRRLQSLRQ
ncbi:unnamed protein product [Moneuplotes crassus]|uniref:Uncharacterized protein n=1 Tax=Euplotes crassus TaxID=5936 RepID=A0AAD1X9D7_EUPCR|nr:unnamed protein product [Moneuplotes crassus]